MEITHSDEVPRYQIEGCLDDEINEMYGNIKIGSETYEASKIIKKLSPEKYEECIIDYCDRENIVIATDDSGRKTYIQI